MIAITQKMAHSAGTDAGNRQMRADGRTKWKSKDYRLACETYNRLIGDDSNCFFPDGDTVGRGFEPNPQLELMEV